MRLQGYFRVGLGALPVRAHGCVCLRGTPVVKAIQKKTNNLRWFLNVATKPFSNLHYTGGLAGQRQNLLVFPDKMIFPNIVSSPEAGASMLGAGKGIWKQASLSFFKCLAPEYLFNAWAPSSPLVK